uniref:plexin-B3-like n=1 Tax=Pristiophorus japonicus TaxID=55135 RepID=UPI00398F040A
MSLSAALMLVGLLSVPGAGPYPTFRRPGARLTHSALDPRTGQLYLGAVNRLYQLSGDVGAVLSEAATGPVNDSRDCIPPITPRDCPQARPTDAHNQLLLVDREGQALLVCASVHQGVCEKRSLAGLAQGAQRAPQPGETQYVAADDPGTATVGALGRSGGARALFVGRGYTHKPTDAPVTTRRLDGAHAFSNEDLGKLVVGGGGFAEYDHHFAAVYARPPHVYFVFYRRDPPGRRSGPEYRAYVARICADDPSYYSYVEVPLECRGAEGEGRGDYGLVLASALGRHRGRRPALFALLARARPPPAQSRPAEPSALCVYPLADLDRTVERARQACYSSADAPEAYVEYGVKSSCTQLPKMSPSIFPCGDEHTPSPIASRVKVQAVAAVTSHVQLTAVAVTVEANNTVVFMGDRLGRLHKVFLKSLSEAEAYSTLTIDQGSPVNKDLLFDAREDHLYVMTTSQVVKVPVSECPQYTDCAACLGARDPYCGWCVLQGRCSRKLECDRHQEANHWLWVYETNGRCLSVHSKIPANLSREEQREITMTIDRLPDLAPGEGFRCSFGEHMTAAVVTGNLLSCRSPDTDRLPSNDPGKDHVTMELAVWFRKVVVATTEFVFYDCGAVKQLHPSCPCKACVTSDWNCNWCLKEHRCINLRKCAGENIIFSQKDHEAAMKGPDHCPYVESIEGSTLIPVRHDTALKLIGRNLDLLENEEADYECVVGINNSPLIMRAVVQRDTHHPGMFNITCAVNKYEYSAPTMEYQVTVFVRTGLSFRIDSWKELNVTLYDCAVGRSDCSRCQVSDGKYGCAWCGAMEPSCLYRGSCRAEVVRLCPPPIIQEIHPLTGPIEGGISLTITGTNLGQRFTDIEGSVTVAGLPCLPDLAGYLVST